MLSLRQRAVGWAAGALAGIWLLAAAGFWISDSLKVTAARVQAYVESVDLSKLSVAARAKALKALADKINALSLEERQQMRLDRSAYRWFGQMTEVEKGTFIEATMPTGFKQMISAFEEMPEERKRRVIGEVMKNIRDLKGRSLGGSDAMRQGTNGPAVSEELQSKVRTDGLKSFYSQSSAQTKAELAPMLEELQRAMESGRAFRGR